MLLIHDGEVLYHSYSIRIDINISLYPLIPRWKDSLAYLDGAESLNRRKLLVQLLFGKNATE